MKRLPLKTWTDIAFDYLTNDTPLACPYCKSSEINVTQGSHGNRMWIDFVCKNCGSADHFDGFSK